jgi:hypothetical protein
LSVCSAVCDKHRATHHGCSVCSQEENEPAGQARWRLRRRSHGAPGALGEYTTHARRILVGKLAQVRVQCPFMRWFVRITWSLTLRSSG